MLLAIDVGNTHVVFGVFDKDKLVNSWRLQSSTKTTVDEFALQVIGLLESSKITVDSINKIIICCVVPILSRVFIKISQKYFKIEPLIAHSGITDGVETGIKIDCDDPSSVGADRIVNAIACKKLYGTPAIVIDFGTATTFDVIDKNGAYQGGLIAPGVLISTEALSEKTAVLPSIELAKPKNIIGKNTKDAMLSGIYFGYLSLVDGIVKRIKEELGGSAKVIVTGGLSSVFAGDLKSVDNFVPDLTLRGLQIIAEHEYLSK